MHDLVVDRGAECRRIDAPGDAVALERGDRAALARQVLGDAIEVGRRDARAHRGVQLGEHLGDDDVRRAHDLDLFRSLEHDH